ncbi:MAG: DUF1295 domain-containing protein [Pseudomonadales bacterium]|nr:DUF1295 domain-containing protein [Pseudomonadales bacterium]MCP5183101.1 DUF1295 domain-containing protein [Pseudomonadales bacterium]
MNNGNWDGLLWLWITLAVVVFLVLLFVSAPYGRHVRDGWGPTLSATVAWVGMESASLFALWWGVLNAAAGGQPVLLPLLLWTAHYVYRAWIYPLRAHARARRMPVIVMLMAVAFNGVNGYTNGIFIGSGWVQENAFAWSDMRTWLGLCLFVLGAGLNIGADNELLRLRRQGGGYRIPRGVLHARISCPNYLGELIEWTGFAVLCWNLPALAFAVWTVANLVPRALEHHRWYLRTFPDYPRSRRALVPFLL